MIEKGAASMRRKEPMSATPLRTLSSALGVCAALALALFAGRADALDPSRTLTQCLLRKWQVQQGLPQATIFAIRQTADGYLWLGTQTGLFRFDGVRFSGVRGSKEARNENLWVQALCEDAEHDLWIATDGAGLLRLADSEITQYRQADGLPSDNVRCLALDRRGNLWIGAEGGLAKFAQGRFSAVSLASEILSNDVRAICEASDGTIWIGGEGNRLAAFNGAELRWQALDSVDASAAVGALLASADGALWIGTTAGLVRLKDGQERCFTRADGLADDWVNCLAEGRDGGLWVGTKDGFSRVLNGEIESFRAQDGLSQSTVYTLCEDHEGSLWAGTKHGLNQFVDRRTIPFTASEGLPSNNTGPVFQDRAGTLWVGTLDAGLARFDGRQFSIAATSAKGLGGNRVLSLADGDEGDVWIGTDRGLSRLRAGRVAETLTVEQGLPSNVIHSLCRDRRGILWAGTSAGLAEFRDGRFAASGAADAELLGPVLALAEGRGGSLLAAIEGAGVFRVRDGQFHALDGAGGGLQNAAALYQDEDGLLWIGSRGSGLYLVDGEKTHRFAVKDGLYDDEIFGIVADGDDRLWMACSKGIFFVSRGELRKFAAGDPRGVTSTPFSPTDALRTIECQEGVQPGIWKMQDGRIWFSTVRGLIVIDPRRLERALPPPPVVVEEVKVNGQRQRPAEIGKLPPGRTNLDFRYTALSFASPTRIEFRYRLEGFDKDWVEAGSRREAFYTNLPPGDYRFRAAARTAAGAWSEAPNPLAFALEPHFYQTRGFLPLLVFLLGLAAWGAYRIRMRRIQVEWRAVLAERGRIARGRARGLAHSTSAKWTVKGIPISSASLPLAAKASLRVPSLNDSLSGHSNSA